MIKHLEVKTYEYGDIKVMVETNFDTGKISLVEKKEKEFNADFRTEMKKWVFVQRGLEYMNGWLNILDAMKYAIEQARDELKAYQAKVKKDKEDDVTEILMQATDLVKKKGKKK